MATILLAAYAVVWFSLEGDLTRVLLLAFGAAIVAAGHLGQRVLGGRTLSRGRWLAITAGIGLLIGLSCGLLALALMAVKTGLHGHGPEFSPAAIDWVIRQTPMWGAAGLLAGAGVGFLSAEVRRSRRGS